MFTSNQYGPHAAGTALAMLCAAALLVPLAGCGTTTADADEGSRYSAVAIVAADTITNPAPRLTDGEERTVKDVMLSAGTDAVMLVSAGGEPAVVHPDFVEFDPSEGNPTGNNVRAKSNMLELGDAMASMHAKTAEQNTFEAVAMAADFLRARADGTRPGLLLIHSNGMDSVGQMDMTKWLATGDPDEVAMAVGKANPGLSLDGVAVRMTGTGYVADDAPSGQHRPTAAVRTLLEQVWTRTLQAFKPSDVAMDRTPLSGGHAKGATEQVTPVALPSATVTCDEQRVDYTLPSALLFEPDSATPTAAAKDELAEPARILTDAPDATATIVGHVYASPGDTEEQYQSMSQARAQAIADLLVRDYGVDASRTIVRGVGASQPANADDPSAPSNPEADRRVELSISGAGNVSCTIG
ncbi:OmpA family protein [Bifidobacterium sp. CP2]|uniref:OmpA family protein n=1 Tax=Bifidobacterium sp. CP2 TaxID=2809025 RepID=UPI001BDBC8A6|nr:OmpA family protein [Bifidobacterium sp. CP2]MBT1180777.1 OmpA family protein [Bifidobacterium sp. CP2]